MWRFLRRCRLTYFDVRIDLLCHSYLLHAFSIIVTDKIVNHLPYGARWLLKHVWMTTHLFLSGIGLHNPNSSFDLFNKRSVNALHDVC